MNPTARRQFLDTVKRAARSHAGGETTIDHGAARVVGPEQDPKELFIRQARDSGMQVTCVAHADLSAWVIERLRQYQVESVLLAADPMFKQVGLAAEMAAAGFAMISDVQSDEALFAAGAGVTTALYGVAETGSVLVAGTPDSPRQASLVPPIHIAVLPEDRIVADLLDLMALLSGERRGELHPGLCLITGPSKSADIELNLVKGVHGPRYVHVVVLST